MYRSRIISSLLSIKSIIKSLDFFSTLNDEDIDLLASISSINSYGKDYILHYEKKESNNLLFLVDGLAKAYKIDKHDNEIFLYYVYKESMLSEISNITSNTLYSFSNIELLEDSHILT
ncbi:MAG: Crp/Fnr family transcriptional regulator, partial [Sulfurimonas sp.]|nr:Crp/Fnr family transcriptional regulator [Sulfurimonas sp.]